MSYLAYMQHCAYDLKSAHYQSKIIYGKQCGHNGYQVTDDINRYIVQTFRFSL